MNFSPDGDTFVVSSADGIARLYKVDSGRPVGPPLRHPQQVASAAFDPAEGKLILTRDADKVVRLWKVVPENKPLRTSFLGAAVTGLGYSPDGKFFLAKGKACLWERLPFEKQPSSRPFPRAVSRYIFFHGAWFTSRCKVSFFVGIRENLPLTGRRTVSVFMGVDHACCCLLPWLQGKAHRP